MIDYFVGYYRQKKNRYTQVTNVLQIWLLEKCIILFDDKKPRLSQVLTFYQSYNVANDNVDFGGKRQRPL